VIQALKQSLAICLKENIEGSEEIAGMLIQQYYKLLSPREILTSF
jgi:hypothetical protein